MPTPALRVGLIGFGYAGKTFHAPLIRSTPGLALTAVASSDPGKVAQALGGGVAVEADPRALAARPDIDLVVVASPNATHFALAADALARGKHVVVDKPFTAQAAEALELARLAESRGLLLSVFHNRRWDSTTLTARALLASDRLGPIRHAAMHFDRFRPQPQARWKEDVDAGGGLWMDLGPHLLDEALLYFGKPLAIQADLGLLRPGGRADDCFHARLRYADGLRVELAASMLAAIARPRLALHGLRGSYVKQGMDPQEAALKAGRLPVDDAHWGADTEQGAAVLDEGDGLRSLPLATANGAYPAYYRQVRDAIRGLAPNPVPAREAAAVMVLLEAGRASHAARREIALDAWPH